MDSDKINGDATAGFNPVACNSKHGIPQTCKRNITSCLSRMGSNMRKNQIAGMFAVSIATCNVS